MNPEIISLLKQLEIVERKIDQLSDDYRNNKMSWYVERDLSKKLYGEKRNLNIQIGKIKYSLIMRVVFENELGQTILAEHFLGATQFYGDVFIAK